MTSEGTPAGKESSPAEVRLSRASVSRFSLYLRHLESLRRDGIAKVSSSQLGEALGITDAQVRKDLAWLGSLGHPGIGYVTDELIAAIRHVLGVDRTWLAALVGVGNLGRALLRYRGFEQRGFRVVALFDIDPGKIGTPLEGLTVHDVRMAGRRERSGCSPPEPSTRTRPRPRRPARSVIVVGPLSRRRLPCFSTPPSCASRRASARPRPPA